MKPALDVASRFLDPAAPWKPKGIDMNISSSKVIASLAGVLLDLLSSPAGEVADGVAKAFGEVVGPRFAGLAYVQRFPCAWINPHVYPRLPSPRFATCERLELALLEDDDGWSHGAFVLLNTSEFTGLRSFSRRSGGMICQRTIIQVSRLETLPARLRRQ